MNLKDHQKHIIKLAVLGSFPLWSKPLTWWLAYSSSSTLGMIGQFGLAFETFSTLCFLGAGLVVLASPLLVGFRECRKASVEIVLVSFLFVSCFIGGEWLRYKVRSNSVERFVVRSRPLIHSIHAYELKYGKPPASLGALVPEFLTEVPSPRVGAPRDYVYAVGEKAAQFDRNPWVVRVSMPSLILGFDQILYFPKQNYPRFGYGGGLERFSDWAYVHE